MQSRLFVAPAILLTLSSCSEEIQAQDQSTLRDEIRASEAAGPPEMEGEAEGPDIELRDPVQLD